MSIFWVPGPTAGPGPCGLGDVACALRAFGLTPAPDEPLPDAAALERALRSARGTPRIHAEKTAAFAALAAAIGIEHGLPAETVSGLLACAAEFATPLAAWWLSELGRWPSSGEGGAEARRQAARLEARGIRELGPIAKGELEAQISAPDGWDQRVFRLLRSHEGSTDVVSLMLDDAGFEGANAGFDEDPGIRVWDGQDSLPLGTCPIPFARAVLSDTFARHEASGRPVPGFLLLVRHWLGREPIVPARRAPAVPAADPPPVGEVPGRETLEALRDMTIARFWFSSAATYAALRRRLPEDFATSAPRSPRFSEDEIEAFLAEIEPVERPLLARRLAEVLEVWALGPVAREERFRLAMRTWQALKDPCVPFAAIPIVVGLAEGAVTAVARNIRFGHRDQHEANQAVEAEQQAGGRRRLPDNPWRFPDSRAQERKD